MLTLILIILPFLFSMVSFALKGEKRIRQFAFAASILEFGVAIAAFVQFRTSCHCQLSFSYPWLESLGVSLTFGMDGISLLLIMLTTFLLPVIILSSFSNSYTRPSAFYGLILLMEMAMIGVFTSRDGLIFYVFWEMALIPAYFICSIWGGKDRIRITFKFFIYTFTGSLFMLVALIWLFLHTPLPHSFNLGILSAVSLSPTEQNWLFLAFFLAFAIKMPVFPFHTWQPDTYTESPTPGTMLLSGIMLKMGVYGAIRFILPICSGALQHWDSLVIILSVTGIVYASLIAVRQDDMKRLIAYSSIAHVGLISAAIFILNKHGLEGAVIQMLAHGINIVGLFAIAGFIEKRTKTRKISDLGGIAFKAPRLALFFMLILLGSIALPLTNGFIGEFMMLLGLFEYNVVFASVAGLTIIFSAVYMLWMYQRTMLGGTNRITENISDLNLTEILTLVPLVIMIFWMGIYPGFFINTIGPDIFGIIERIYK